MNQKPEARSQKPVLLLLLVLLLLAGCKTTLDIEKHPEAYSPGVVQPKYSNINIPLELDVKGMERLVNKQLSGLIYSDSSFTNNDNDNLMIKAWKKSDIALSMNKNDLIYRVPLKVWINKKFEVKSFGLTLSDTKEVEAEIALKFKTHITLNKNYTFSTYTTSEGYEWITTPQLKLGPVSVPITYLADVLVKSNLTTLNKEIDKALLGMLDLRQTIQTVWADIQKPIKVSDQYQLWARITPVELTTLPITGTTTGILNHSIGIKALTELFYGKKPDYTVNTTIPEIKMVSKMENSFSINLSIDLPFEQINEVAKQQMKGYKVVQGKYTLVVGDVDVYGDHENLVVGVKVSGSINGTIYLTGKPYYNRDSSAISIRNLNFDLKTKNVLYKSASWLLKHGLENTLEKKLVFPVGDQLLQTKNEVKNYLAQNRKLDVFTLQGSIQKLDIDDLFITKNSVKVFVILEGSLNVKME